MLQSVQNLHGFTIHAFDGELGAVEDLLWDDGHWAIRYLVVDTGKWLPGRRVLISPAVANVVNWLDRKIVGNLTCDQVRNSPEAETDKPVSRQHEEDLSLYYGWPSYWTVDPFGFEPMSLPVPPPASEKPPQHRGDRHLRSARTVRGYQVDGRDGKVGKVEDFVFDDITWRIAFLVVDAGSWLHKKLVLIRPGWVEDIRWEECLVTLSLTSEPVRTSPPFTPVFPIPSEYAAQLVKHYQRTGDA